MLVHTYAHDSLVAGISGLTVVHLACSRGIDNRVRKKVSPLTSSHVPLCKRTCATAEGQLLVQSCSVTAERLHERNKWTQEWTSPEVWDFFACTTSTSDAHSGLSLTDSSIKFSLPCTSPQRLKLEAELQPHKHLESPQQPKVTIPLSQKAHKSVSVAISANTCQVDDQS